jgi:hypothetical protein
MQKPKRTITQLATLYTGLIFGEYYKFRAHGLFVFLVITGHLFGQAMDLSI